MDNLKYRIYSDGILKTSFEGIENQAAKIKLKICNNYNIMSAEYAESAASFENLHSTNPEAHKAQFDAVETKISNVEIQNTELQQKLDSKSNFDDLPTKLSDLENDCSCVSIVNQKANMSLDNITEDGVNLIKSYIPNPESSSTCFSVNSGHVNAGRAEILYSDDLRYLKFRTPIIATKADGKTFTVNNLNSIDFFGKVDGTYNIALTETSAEQIGDIFRQNAAPFNEVGNIWLDTSVEPLKAFKYDQASGGRVNSSQDEETQTRLTRAQEASWQPYDGVPLGSVTIVGGSISAVKTFDYNYNGYDIKNTLTAREMVVNWRVPDYSSRIAVVYGNNYVAPRDGIFYIASDGGGIDYYMSYSVDGVSIKCCAINCASLAVSKGQKIKFGSGNITAYMQIFFIPFKS